MQSYFESFTFSDRPDEVPIGLSFLSDTTLITPHEYNKRGDENTEWEKLGLYAVSVKDFREVTGLEEATSDYMMFFDGYWIFDYLTKFYTDNKERNDAMIKRLKLLTPEQKEQAKRGEYSKLPALPTFSDPE